MAPSKRQASPTRAATSKKVKASPTTEEHAAPIPAEIEPVFELLRNVDLPKSCKDMLQAAVLPCLRTEKDNRHIYQEQVADILSSLFANVEAGRCADVAQIEEQCAALAKERGEAMERAETARASATAVKEKSDNLAVLADTADKALQAGRAACQAAHEKHRVLLQKGVERTTEKEGLQKIGSDLLRPLEVGEVTGAQWRRRDKMCKDLVDFLRPLGLEESLALALTPALKEKVEQRGIFAKKAVQFASDLLAGSIDNISNEIVGLEGEAAQQLQEEETLKAEADNLRAAWDASVENYNAMQNEWADQQTNANEVAEVVKSFEPRQKDIEQNLEAAKSRLEAFSANMSKFRQLMENGAKVEFPAIAQAEIAVDMVTLTGADEN